MHRRKGGRERIAGGGVRERRERQIRGARQRLEGLCTGYPGRHSIAAVVFCAVLHVTAVLLGTPRSNMFLQPSATFV